MQSNLLIITPYKTKRQITHFQHTTAPNISKGRKGAQGRNTGPEQAWNPVGQTPDPLAPWADWEWSMVLSGSCALSLAHLNTWSRFGGAVRGGAALAGGSQSLGDYIVTPRLYRLTPFPVHSLPHPTPALCLSARARVRMHAHTLDLCAPV